MSAAIRYLEPLPNDATKLQRLRWRRRVSLKVALPSLPLVAFAGPEIDQAWFYAAVAALALVWVTGLAMLSLDIRRAR
jgi:hypothetical protein